MINEDDYAAELQQIEARLNGAAEINFTPKSKILQESMKLKKHQAEMLLDRLKPDFVMVDEAHHLDRAFDKVSVSSARAASMLEAMAEKFTLNFNNMDDVKYRIFGKAYLQHKLDGVSTGRYYDQGLHMISGNEAVNLMRSESGKWSTTSAAQQKAIDYMGFIAELKQYIVAGYALSVIALKVMDFFNVGTNAVSYRVASYIARRLHDLIFLVDGGNVNNSFWRAMAVVQLVIKRTENDNQHVGYASETDLRGLATSLARHPTFTVASQMIMADNIDNMYWSYYA